MKQFLVSLYFMCEDSTQVWYDLVAEATMNLACHWPTNDALDDGLRYLENGSFPYSLKEWSSPKVLQAFMGRRAKFGDILVLSTECEEHGYDRRSYRLIGRKESALGYALKGAWEHQPEGAYMVWEDRFRKDSQDCLKPCPETTYYDGCDDSECPIGMCGCERRWNQEQD